MKVSAQSMNSPVAVLARGQLNEDQFEHSTNVDCEGDVIVEQAYIDYDSKLHGCRPYLTLIGHVKTIKGPFLQGVKEVTLDKPQTVTCNYMFSNDELSILCKKGLFDEGFSCPDIFYKNTFELPMQCNCMAIVPEKEDDAPLIFVTVKKPYNLQTDSASSGYTISDYFEKTEQAVKYDDIEDIVNYDISEFSKENVIEDTTISHEAEIETEPVQPAAALAGEDKIIADEYESVLAKVAEKMEKAESESETVTQSVDETVEVKRVSSAHIHAAVEAFEKDEENEYEGLE